MQNSNTSDKKYFNAPKKIMIDNIAAYSERDYLVQYRCQNCQLQFVALLAKAKAEAFFGDNLENYDPQQIYVMFGNGQYINYINYERTGF